MLRSGTGVGLYPMLSPFPELVPLELMARLESESRWNRGLESVISAGSPASNHAPSEIRFTMLSWEYMGWSLAS
jgi:hypothetical protein